MNEKIWINFAKADGRRSLPNLFVAVVKDIIGDISTTANTKVVEITRELGNMERVESDESLPMDAKEASAPTEALKECSHHYTIIDLGKVESLMGRVTAEKVLRNEG